MAINVWQEQKGPAVVCVRDGAPWDPLTTSAALPPDTGQCNRIPTSQKLTL